MFALHDVARHVLLQRPKELRVGRGRDSRKRRVKAGRWPLAPAMGSAGRATMNSEAVGHYGRLMAETLLESLLQTAKKDGWAVGQFAPFHESWPVAASLDGQAGALGLTAVPNRRGDAPVQELQPTTLDTAHPASLSAQVGLGEQPLHTDGAHLRRPPDYVILWCTEPSATPTRLWRPPIARLLTSPDQNGVFLVRSGSDTWLATALSGADLRFDPGCMTPADASARRLSEALQAPPEGDVQEVVWDMPGMVLLIRNRRVLHGRAAVVEGDLDRRLSRVAYREGTP